MASHRLREHSTCLPNGITVQSIPRSLCAASLSIWHWPFFFLNESMIFMSTWSNMSLVFSLLGGRVASVLHWTRDRLRGCRPVWARMDVARDLLHLFKYIRASLLKSNSCYVNWLDLVIHTCIFLYYCAFGHSRVIIITSLFEGKQKTLTGHFNGIYLRLNISHSLDSVVSLSGWKASHHQHHFY